jgi:hypothetical protein
LPRRSRAGSIEDGGSDQEKSDRYGQRRLVHETSSPLYMEGSVISLLPLGTCDPGSLDGPDQVPRVKVLQKISAGPGTGEAPGSPPLVRSCLSPSLSRHQFHSLSDANK